MRNWVFVKVVIDQAGLFGWGEGSVSPKWKPQISPLRYAPVEMTNLFAQEELSSRPERSVVERSAVSISS